MFEHVDAYAGDPILTLVETFNKDTRESKVNLGIGLYYDEAGRIPLLESVRQAEAARAAQPAARPYQPMEGAANYRQAVQHLLFGAEHPAVKEGRIATIQTIGGSGAIKIGADLLKRYFPASEVWVSSPTWDNHRSMFEGAGFKVHDYPYYDASTGGVNFAAMLDTLKSLPAKSIVLLHRTARGWLEVGSAALDDPDLGEALTYLRRSALGLAPHGVATKLIIPNSQILYTEVPAPGPDVDARSAQIRRALFRHEHHLIKPLRGQRLKQLRKDG